MFELLLFDARNRGVEEEGAAFLSVLKGLKLEGVPREETNRKYFTWWSGRLVSEVRSTGREWFEQAGTLHSGPVYHPPVLDRIRHHKSRGDQIVLVSGSFLPALDPLAFAISVDMVLASTPHVSDGRYTGDISTPMIGLHKANAVAEHARAQGVSLRDSYAYGDDTSDAAFMQLVGHPIVVARPSSVFALEAGRRNWNCLSPDN